MAAAGDSLPGYWRSKINRACLSLTLLAIGSLAQAQPAIISGQVTGENEEPLASATIMLLRAQDSILQQFALTDNEGQFTIKNTRPGQYLLQTAFLGYENHSQLLEIQEGQPSADLGTIRMQARSELLDEVVVKEERIPMAIRKDTIEFDAGAFKTQPNAVVEDLLKKLPGVEVGRDGSIRAMGQDVERVTVDGKEFFGKDPKLATQNLPADAVDKVQVFDKKSDRAEFSGIDDGQREKTINLSLKEDKRRATSAASTRATAARGATRARATSTALPPKSSSPSWPWPTTSTSPAFLWTITSTSWAACRA